MGGGLSKHPEHAQLIGQIVAHWNVIEDVAARLLGVFIGADQFIVSQLFASFQSRGRLEFLRTAGRRFLKSSPLSTEFDSLTDELEKRLNARNTFAHGLYALDEADRLLLMHRKFELTNPHRAETLIDVAGLCAEWDAVVATYNRTTRFYQAVHDSLSEEHQELLLRSWSFQNPDMRPPT